MMVGALDLYEDHLFAAMRGRLSLFETFVRIPR